MRVAEGKWRRREASDVHSLHKLEMLLRKPRANAPLLADPSRRARRAKNAQSWPLPNHLAAFLLLPQSPQVAHSSRQPITTFPTQHSSNHRHRHRRRHIRREERDKRHPEPHNHVRFRHDRPSPRESQAIALVAHTREKRLTSNICPNQPLLSSHPVISRHLIPQFLQEDS